jgi:hypothetical protein
MGKVLDSEEDTESYMGDHLYKPYNAKKKSSLSTGLNVGTAQDSQMHIKIRRQSQE